MNPYILPGVHNSLGMPATGIGPPNIVDCKKGEKKHSGYKHENQNEKSLFISREEEEKSPLGTSFHSVSTKRLL